ncbi:hypothetical protein FACS1894160_4960 [Bacteroidia bacterium]|nr:hypothetical protein FACS1894123_11420 [Bacteroidia bacterium]GHV09436.1 hypothetical protein FACS1894160_4960 [Bacteroidia bacterium]
MKKEQDYIRKLVDYILLNAYSVNSANLGDGKSGLSLCLFEMAGYLDDEDIEEQAYILLQESLALMNKGESTSFHTRPADIGFVLLYLITYQFIDADYDELFGEESNKMITSTFHVPSTRQRYDKFGDFTVFINSKTRL